MSDKGFVVREMRDWSVGRGVRSYAPISENETYEFDPNDPNEPFVVARDISAEEAKALCYSVTAQTLFWAFLAKGVTTNRLTHEYLKFSSIAEEIGVLDEFHQELKIAVERLNSIELYNLWLGIRV